MTANYSQSVQEERPEPSLGDTLNRSDMSLYVKIFSGGEKVGMKHCHEDGTEKLPEGEELLLSKEEFLKKKIDQELLFAKKNCRTNRRGEVLNVKFMYASCFF